MYLYIIALFLFWIILNGKITFEIIIFGALITFLISMFVIKITNIRTLVKEASFNKIMKVLKYIAVLLIEVYKANIGMIKIVLSPSANEIRPVLFKTKVNLNSTLARVALANSITLTPGTITVSMNKDEYLIHAIDKTYQEDIEKSIFVEKLKDLED